MDKKLEKKYKRILCYYSRVHDVSYWCYYFGEKPSDYKKRYAALIKNIDQDDYEIWKFNYLEEEYQKLIRENAWFTFTYTAENGAKGPFTDTVPSDGIDGFLDWVKNDCDGTVLTGPVPATKEEIKNNVIAYQCLGEDDPEQEPDPKALEDFQKFYMEQVKELKGDPDDEDIKKA